MGSRADLPSGMGGGEKRDVRQAVHPAVPPGFRGGDLNPPFPGKKEKYKFSLAVKEIAAE